MLTRPKNELIRSAALVLMLDGWTFVDIGRVLGISAKRASMECKKLHMDIVLAYTKAVDAYAKSCDEQRQN